MSLVIVGGLMSYRVSVPDLFRCVATYVGRISKGAKPGDLPIETIPASLLLRADQVIE